MTLNEDFSLFWLSTTAVASTVTVAWQKRPSNLIATHFRSP